MLEHQGEVRPSNSVDRELLGHDFWNVQHKQPMEINLARFDLVSIRLALLCAELGSLSAASKQMHCSLSTGSYRLSSLEDTFGTPLFTRDRRGLQITTAGELFVQHANSLLNEVEMMMQHVTSFAKSNINTTPLPSNFSNAQENPNQPFDQRLVILSR